MMLASGQVCYAINDDPPPGEAPAVLTDVVR